MRQIQIISLMLVFVFLSLAVYTGVFITSDYNENAESIPVKTNIDFVCRSFSWMEAVPGDFQLSRGQNSSYKEYGNLRHTEELKETFKAYLSYAFETPKVRIYGYHIRFYLEIVLFTLMLTVISYRYKQDGKKRLVTIISN